MIIWKYIYKLFLWWIKLINIILCNINDFIIFLYNKNRFNELFNKFEINKIFIMNECRIFLLLDIVLLCCIVKVIILMMCLI